MSRASCTIGESPLPSSNRVPGDISTGSPLIRQSPWSCSACSHSNTAPGRECKSSKRTSGRYSTFLSLWVPLALSSPTGTLYCTAGNGSGVRRRCRDWWRSISHLQSYSEQRAPLGSGSFQVTFMVSRPFDS